MVIAPPPPPGFPRAGPCRKLQGPESEALRDGLDESREQEAERGEWRRGKELEGARKGEWGQRVGAPASLRSAGGDRGVP